MGNSGDKGESSLATKVPMVGIGVFVFRDGKLLVGRRKGSHGAGTFACPGGHLDHLESFEECSRRETREETGLEIENVRFLMLANVDAFAPKHYVHVHMVADALPGEAKLMEPEKCESWDWYGMDALPSPLFGTMILALESLRTGQQYFTLEEARARLRPDG